MNITKSRREFLGHISATLGASAFGQINFQKGNEPVQNERVQKLFNAIENGHAQKVKILLTQNRDLIQSRRNGLTPFAFALLKNRTAIANQIKTLGYEPDLHESALAADWEKFEEYIDSKGDRIAELVNQDHAVGGTAMFAAAYGNAGNQIWRVYAAGGDPNKYPNQKHSRTPLQQALRNQNLEIAELTASTLLANNANANLAGKADSPPLHLAVIRQSRDLVEMLIRLGADPGAVDSKGKTAAELAASLESRAIADLLADEAKILSSCYSSRSALDRNGQPYRAPDLSSIPIVKCSQFVGSCHGQFAKVKELSQKNAKLVHSVATTGERAVEAAAHMGNKPIVNYLLDNGAPYSILTATVLGDLDSMKKMIAEDENRINERGPHDFALLWYPAIGRCKLDITEFLLENGADIEGQNYLGTTALHWAAMTGNVDLVKLLIENGADVNRVGRKFGGSRQSPLQLARNEKVRALLKQNGAK